MTAIAATMQAFFTERLIGQRRASPHTITAYRDTLRLLLGFAATANRDPAVPPGHRGPGRPDDQRVPRPRSNTSAETASGPATPGWPRSTPCSASRRCATPSTPPTSPGSWRSRPSGPTRRSSPSSPPRKPTRCSPAPDRATRTGRRDHAWILLAIQTGLRASELTALTCGDVHLGAGAYVACHGKGRKDRITPLAPGTVTTLRAWLAERGGTPDAPAVRHQPRRADEPRRPATAPQPLHCHRSADLPLPGQQKRHSPRPAALGRHGIAARRGRHHRHRLVARPRIGHHHADLPASRHGAQAASTRPDHAARQPPRAATGPPTSSWPSSKPCDYADIASPAHPRQPAPTARVSA